MKKFLSVFILLAIMLSSCTMVTYADKGAELNKTNAQVKVGEKLQLQVTGTNSTIKWKSKDKTIATVNQNGVVTGKKYGKVNIIAKVDGEKLKCKVSVKSNYTTKEEIVESILSSMTVEEKVGQMFYVRCPDTDAVNTVEKYNLGGYILFGKDFKGKTKSQVQSAINKYQNKADIPLLIGVDEEGGTVVRVSSNPNLRSTPFLSPKDTYAKGGWSAVKLDAQEKADLLLSLGINVNMAPVCDIVSNKNSFMYDRSFSSEKKMVKKFVKQTVTISKSNDLGTVLKHFPGYGNNEDTHTGIAYDNRAYSKFENKDFKPFITGINNGADCVLVAHNIVKCMDKKYPASLSKKVHNILRDELNFDGVIMTDDLSMDAIENYTNGEDAAVRAVKCGNDIICCTDVATQYPAVLKAVQNGDISIKKIDNAVRRILNWKYDLGLLS